VFDLIILDVWLPGGDGLETLTTLRERGVDAQVVMISGHGSIEAAVRAIKQGAFEFIEKSLSLDKTVLVVRNALRQRRLEVENQALRADADRRQIMVGDSPVMAELRAQVALAAPTNGRVLIQGENGTGKELVARSLHALSRRSVGPFVDVNCTAMPEELIESELFGHVRGAFTGAMHDRPGKFELADERTIFLDEIADMSLKTQAKVLRVLQEQVVERVGGRAGGGVDVRVVAATNKSLSEEIRAGRFRDDLFYRLNVVSITVPPLRDRRDDVVPLSERFLTIYAGEYGHGLKRIDSDALRTLRLARERARISERDRTRRHHGTWTPHFRAGSVFFDHFGTGRPRCRSAARSTGPFRARLHSECARGPARQYQSGRRRAWS